MKSFFKKIKQTIINPEKEEKEINPLNSSTQSNNKKEQKNITGNNQNSNKMTVKESKGQFDFSEEDDEEDIKGSSKVNENNNENPDNILSTQTKILNKMEICKADEEENPWLIAHQLYLKNSMLDIEGMTYIPFIKVKKNENLFSFIGFGKKSQYNEVKYLALFDEHFIYHINMTSKENNQNNNYKKIGNHYNLKTLTNVEIKEDDILQDKKIISLLFVLDNGINSFQSITKNYHFELKYAMKFFNTIKLYLEKYKIPLHFKDSQNYSGKEKITKIEDTNIEISKDI